MFWFDFFLVTCHVRQTKFVSSLFNILARNNIFTLLLLLLLLYHFDMLSLIIIIIIKVIYCPPYYELQWPGITESVKI